MKIYDKADRLILDVTVNDNSYRNRAIMGDHNLTLYYSLAQHVEIPVGSYCEFEGQTYTLMRPEQFKMKHRREYEYTVVFSSEQDKAKIWKFRNPVDGRLKFPLTAKPKEHLQMFVDNMNRRDTGWTVGDCIDDVEKLITYDHDYCWDALTKQAKKFETEFEIVGKRVSLRKVEYNKSNPLPLSYGRGNGFKSGIGRSNSGSTPPTEILFVQGGNQNIDRSKYPEDETLRASSNGCLLLPVGQTIGYDGEHFEDETGYNEAEARHYMVDNLGLSISNIDREKSSLAEDSLDRSDDYPKREGKVSKVVAVDKDKNFYDFTDNTIPDDLNYEDYLIEGETMTVIFQSGMLAGREFDVKYYHKPKNLNGVQKDGKRFEIVPQEIDGITMPNEQFKPQAGVDTYAVFHVMLPDYIRNDEDKSGASWDMFRAAVKYLFDNEERKYTFTGELDGIWAKKDWLNIGGRIRLGGFVRFTDENFEKDGVLVRITNIKDYINNPHAPKIELSNETISGTVSSTLKELGATEVVIEDNLRTAIQYTKRRFRDAKETIEMLDKAMLDNFTSSISPVAVQTMSMLVGDESLQFVFTERINSDVVVQHGIKYDQENKVLTAPQSYIKHMTLGINTVKETHASDEYKRWTIAPFTSPALAEAEKSYYLYAKVSETTSSGEFRLSEDAKKMNPGDGFYYLLVGILNSEYNGERSFATLHGFTEVLPGRITTDQIVSNDGETYFNLLLGEIGGKIKFKAGTSGLENVEGYGEFVTQINEAKGSAADAKKTANEAKDAVDTLNNYVDNAFADGIITQQEAKTIKAYINVIESTKVSVQATYAQLYTNPLLTGDPKANLKTKYDAFGTRLTNLVNAINAAIADGKATTQEANTVNTCYSLFNTAYSEYQTAVEDALAFILASIDDKAGEALSTANQAVSDAADAKKTANEAKDAASDAASAVDDLNNYVDGAFKDGVVDLTEVQTIKAYIKACATEKANADAAYNKLVSNEHLLNADGTDTTAKTTLTTRKNSYDTAYTNLINAINNAIADGKATSAEQTTVNNRYTSYNTAYANLTTAIEEAYAFIFSQILTSADASAKEDVAKLGETLIEGGFIRTNLINVDELIVRHVIAGEDGGQRIELDPITKRILVVSADGTTTFFEGNQYATPTSLFGGASGTLSMIKASGTISNPAKLNSSSTNWIVLSNAFHTDTPVEITVNGFLKASATCNRNPDTSSSGGTQPTIKPVQLNHASTTLQYYIRTYSDANCTNRLDSTQVASVNAYADGIADVNGNYPNLSMTSTLPVTNAKAVIPVGGYHRLELYVNQSRTGTGGTSTGAYGSVSGESSSKATSGSYSADYYISRFFNNGFLLGTRSNNYILAYKTSNGMEFVMENNGYGFRFSSAGLQYKKNNGSWTNLV